MIDDIFRINQLIAQQNSISEMLKQQNQIAAMMQSYDSQMGKVIEPYNQSITNPLAASISHAGDKLLGVASLAGESINTNISESLGNVLKQYSDELGRAFKASQLAIESVPFGILQSIYPDNLAEEDQQETIDTDKKIITEIYEEENYIKKDSDAIIVLSPINDKVLKYLAENPEALYQLQPGEFETVMAEIYSKLGYNVKQTQATRDGGKDIILRKPSMLGDFVYYVECKKYSPKNPVGVGIVRSMAGTINTDRVNGGFIATTSYFTHDARQFILNNNWNYQIQLHDFEKIKILLNTVMK